VKSTTLGPLIALSALAVAPSVALAQEPASTPATTASTATTPDPAPVITTPAASTPVASTPADTTPASTPGSTTPQATDPDIKDVTGKIKGESDRRAARRKAREEQADRDPAPAAGTQATDQTLIDPSLLNVTAVPNFFIQDFDIPPFLLPIYQAAGSEYGIRWEVLAGINKVETNYGRNLNVSSAGALGWMQFMPATWEQYGVDADDNGVKDPFNPADAIFAAARYLKAAGGDTDLRKGVFAYNHADWYVDEVLANARNVAAIPDSLVSSLTGLTQGIFPVVGSDSKIDYDGKLKSDSAAKTVKVDDNAADPVESKDDRNSIEISAPSGSQVVAVQDGTVEKVGQSDRLGKYVRLRDSYGNRYTYAHLGEVQDKVPVPKPVKDDDKNVTETDDEADTASGTDGTITIPKDATPTSPATAGSATDIPAPTTDVPVPSTGDESGATTATADQATTTTVDPTLATSPTTPAATTPTATTPAAAATTDRSRLSSSGEESTAKNLAETPRRIRFRARDAVTENAAPEPVEPKAARLYAHPSLPDAYAAGGEAQLNPETTVPDALPTAPVGELSDYFSLDYGLKASDVNLKKLKAGQAVIAGTVLGKTQVSTDNSEPSKVTFEIRPAGKKAPRIDPKPILDGWRLSDETNFFGAQAKKAVADGTADEAATVGQILLMSKEQLSQRVLADKRISIYECGRRDIEAGQIDRRILALLEVLATKGMTPNVTALKCGHGVMTASGNVSEHSYGTAVDIGSVYGTVISPSTQGPGSITDKAVREILKLQGNMKPHQIITLMKYEGEDNTLALADHYNHIHVGYAPTEGVNGKQLEQLLKPGQWDDLVSQLSKIKVPNVSAAPSDYAVTVKKSSKTK
jgi:membrane-bound lytic murein transglycosylase B